MRGRRISVRRALGFVLATGVLMGIATDQAWRLGFPRRLRFDDRTAVDRLATAIHADVRKYDRLDVEALIDSIIARRVFIGATEAEVVARLGLEHHRPQFHPPGGLAVRVGMLPSDPWGGDVEIEFRFDANGRCEMVTRRLVGRWMVGSRW